MRYLGFLFPVRCPRTACCRADSSPFEPRGSLLMSAQPSRRKCRTLRARLLAQCQSGVVDGNALACHGVNFPRSRFGLVLSFRHEPRRSVVAASFAALPPRRRRKHGVRNGDLNANCNCICRSPDCPPLFCERFLVCGRNCMSLRRRARSISYHECSLRVETGSGWLR